MDPDQQGGRIEAGPILSALGALLLLVALFVDWYDPGGTAWEVFEVWDVVLATLVLVALYSAFEEISGRPRQDDRLLLAVGLIAIVVVLSQLLNDPPAATDADKDRGIWLALAGAALMTLGSVLSSWRISIAVVTDRVGATDQRPTEPLDDRNS